jgi:hypothetical protein
MRSVVVIIRDVFGQQSAKMAFVQGDDVVQQLPLATADPAFRHSVLPEALERGLKAGDVHGTKRCGNFEPVFCVVIEDEKPGCGLIGECLPQLPHDPTARRMPGDIAVQNAPAVMPNHEEAIEEAEGYCRDREEVYRGDGFAMVAKKG